MAIVEMRKMALLGLIKDRKALYKTAQALGCFQMRTADPESDQKPAAHELQSIEEELGKLRFAIQKLNHYSREKQSTFAPKPEAALDDYEQALEKGKYKQLIARLEQEERQAGELRGAQARLSASIEQLEPWLPLDLGAEQLHSTRDCHILLGSLPSKELDTLKPKLDAQPVALRVVSTKADTSYVLIVVYHSALQALNDELKSRRYTQIPVWEGRGTALECQKTLRNELEALQKKSKDSEAQFQALALELPLLRLSYDALSAEKDRILAENLAFSSQKTFMLHAWLPKPLEERIANKLKNDFPLTAIAFSDPDEGEEAPVLLHNNAFASPFENVVTGFALPSPSGIDPTAMMAPFFACFFGMMVSDAGYGLVMALLIPLLLRISKPGPAGKKMMGILLIGGIATVFWGALYNTWFGFAPWPTLFDPINNSMPVMILCIGLGALHLFAGLMMGAYLNFKRKQYLAALFDQFSWCFLLVGLGLLALPATAQLGQILAILGTALILLFAGRDKKNPIKRLISGLGKLYGITSWLSDLLSYMRLFGMGLATGVIGMVINQLVGMIFDAGLIGKLIGAVLFVGAHLFNAGINILGAYVHACRLQYIEFFGKFYEEGGKAFTPLQHNPRFVRIRDAS